MGSGEVLVAWHTGGVDCRRVQLFSSLSDTSLHFLYLGSFSPCVVMNGLPSWDQRNWFYFPLSAV